MMVGSNPVFALINILGFSYPTLLSGKMPKICVLETICNKSLLCRFDTVPI